MAMNLSLPAPQPRFLAIDPAESRWSDWDHAHTIYTTSAEHAAILAAQFMDSQQPHGSVSRSLHIKGPSGRVEIFHVFVEMRPAYSAQLSGDLTSPPA